MRFYRALLVLYPRSFRRVYAEPMLQLFADQQRDLGRRAWLRVAPDLIKTAPMQRIEAVMSSRTARPVAAAAVAVAGLAVVALGVGGPAVFVVALAVAGVLWGQRKLVLGVRRGGRAPLRHAVTQAWWAPVAAFIGVAQILFGIGTVFEASNMGGRIIGSSVMMGIGAVMLFGLMRRPFSREGGNVLILLATVPALTFFWVVIPTVLAVIVWIGVLTSGFSDEKVAAA